MRCRNLWILASGYALILPTPKRQDIPLLSYLDGLNDPADELLPPSSADTPSFTTKEDWALLDSAPAYTIAASTQPLTFWTALSADQPLLSRHSPEALLERHAFLRSLDPAVLPTGPEPPILDAWMKSGDLRYSGRVNGRKVLPWRRCGRQAHNL